MKVSYETPPHVGRFLTLGKSGHHAGKTDVLLAFQCSRLTLVLIFKNTHQSEARALESQKCVCFPCVVVTFARWPRSSDYEGKSGRHAEAGEQGRPKGGLRVVF